MKIETESGDIHVQKNKPLRLYYASNTKICCIAGTIWITSSGEMTDIFLSAGQSHQGQDNSLTLIEGIDEGWIRLERSEQPAYWQQAWAAVGRLWRKKISRTDQAASVPGWSA